MALFEILGKVVGGLVSASNPVLGAALPLLGGAVDANKADRDAAAKPGKDFDAMIEAGKRHGIHKLEMLRSGALSGFQSSVPRVVSNQALLGLSDNLVGEIDGSAERARERAKVSHDLFMLKAEQELSGGAGVIVRNTLARRTPPPTPIIPTDQGDVPLPDLANPTPINPDGSIDTSIDDGGTANTLAPRQTHVSPSGMTLTYPEGPDPMELAVGGALDLTADLKSAFERSKMNEIAADVYIQRGVENLGEKKLEWDRRFGVAPPLAWLWWSNEEKLRYLWRFNKGKK